MTNVMTTDYHQNSKTQQTAARYISSLIPTFLDNLTWLEKEEGPITLVDYGSADGANSQEPVKEILKHLFHLKQKQLPVQVIHNDLPSSNFSFLFDLVQNSAHSYKKDFGEKSQIFCLGSGVSFYEQVVASNTVSLAFSSTAFHWQKDRHLIFQSDALFHWQAQPEEMMLWLKASIEGLKEILKWRTTELRVGGRLLISQLSWSGELKNLATRPPPTIISSIVFKEFVERDQRLTREEARACALPFTVLSASQIESIFTNDQFVPEGSDFGLKVRHFEGRQIKNPLWDMFESGTINALQYAQLLTKSTRAWFSPAFKSYLPERVDKDEIEKVLMQRLEEEIAKDPRATHQELYQAYLILEKVPVS